MDDRNDADQNYLKGFLILGKPEGELIKDMLHAVCDTRENLDKFALWLMIGCAGIVSFLIANADRVMPLLSPKGFLVCGVALCFSCLFGLVARIMSLRGEIGAKVQTSVFDSIRRQEERLAAMQANDGDAVPAVSIDFALVNEMYLKQFPKIVQWWVLKKVKNVERNPFGVQKMLVGSFLKQGGMLALQTISFLFFLFAGILYAHCQQCVCSAQ
ncbi:hypothetical protein NPS29_17430 [Pseudomonas putida]|uniref:hypothetical protein n=1 Tax=Pseudomonas putida TaxID=303 RepID=UPI0023646316|nr:hypothetical protein [Pseudomonas putida]MDD1967115.1 hypothetical protein [Pseudomonas putida]